MLQAGWKPDKISGPRFFYGFAVFLAPAGELKNRLPPSGSMFPQSAK